MYRANTFFLISAKLRTVKGKLDSQHNMQILTSLISFILFISHASKTAAPAAYISFGHIQRYGGLGGDQNIGKIWLVFTSVIYA